MCAIYKASYRNLSRQNYRYAFKLNISSFDRNFLPANKSTTRCAMSCRFPGLCDKPLLTKVSESKNHCLKRKKAACSEPSINRYWFFPERKYLLTIDLSFYHCGC